MTMSGYSMRLAAAVLIGLALSAGPAHASSPPPLEGREGEQGAAGGQTLQTAIEALGAASEAGVREEGWVPVGRSVPGSFEAALDRVRRERSEPGSVGELKKRGADWREHGLGGDGETVDVVDQLTVTPEPATMGLLAVGLVLMAGVPVIRRMIAGAK